MLVAIFCGCVVALVGWRVWVDIKEERKVAEGRRNDPVATMRQGLGQVFGYPDSAPRREVLKFLRQWRRQSEDEGLKTAIDQYLRHMGAKP